MLLSQLPNGARAHVVGVTAGAGAAPWPRRWRAFGGASDHACLSTARKMALSEC